MVSRKQREFAWGIVSWIHGRTAYRRAAVCGTLGMFEHDLSPSGVTRMYGVVKDVRGRFRIESRRDRDTRVDEPAT